MIQPEAFAQLASEPCERTTRGTCADDPSLSPNAKYGRDRYCYPCRVRAALSFPDNRRAEPQPWILTYDGQIVSGTVHDGRGSRRPASFLDTPVFMACLVAHNNRIRSTPVEPEPETAVEKHIRLLRQPLTLTVEETKAMLEAYRDPAYLAALLEDVRNANMVEVDNPFRPEIRPRRGTEQR